MHSTTPPSNASARTVEVIANLADRIRTAGCMGHGWPISKLDDVRNLAIELCSRPPADMDSHLINAARFFRRFLGETALRDMAESLDEAAAQPESLLAVQCYFLTLWGFTALKTVGDAMAAKHN
jgi:hypothetical protein